MTLAAGLAVAKPAPKYAYPPQHFSMKGITDIKVVGVRGNLKMRGSKSRLMTLSVQHTSNRKTTDDWNLSLDRRGHTLFLEVANVTYGKQWRKQIKEELWPEFDIELSGPSRPAIVSWREGHLEFTNWKADLELSYLSGQSKVHGGAGRLKVHQSEADLEIRDWIGPVELKWQKGNVHLERCQGLAQIEGSESDLSVSGGGGELQIELPKGRVSVAGYRGVLKGNGREANWNLDAAAPSDLNVTTGTGNVHLNWRGGAKVFLTTTDGHIKGPGLLQASVREGRKVAEGTLPGKQIGQVFVRTASGAISLSQ